MPWQTTGRGDFLLNAWCQRTCPCLPDGGGRNSRGYRTQACAPAIERQRRPLVNRTSFVARGAGVALWCTPVEPVVEEEAGPSVLIAAVEKEDELEEVDPAA